MSKVRFTLNILAVTVMTLMVASIANAQATRTWVSGVGDDVNPCSRTAPCKTYAGAISKTAVHGEISTLDPGGFGAVTITKSITIEGTQGQGYGSILHSATTGVTINFDQFTAVGESQKSVRLRNLNINGSGGSSAASSGLRGIRITSSGATSSNNSEVTVEDCVIDGSFGNPGRGIEDFRTGGGTLTVSNTTVRNMAQAGIVVDPNGNLAGGSATVKVSISGSRVYSCGAGMNFGSNVKATIYNSAITNITGSGVFAIQNSAGTTEVSVDHCAITSNGTGLNASSGNTIIRVSNSTVMNNTTLAATAGGGQVLSYGNNQSAGVAFPGGVSPT